MKFVLEVQQKRNGWNLIHTNLFQAAGDSNLSSEVAWFEFQ